MRLRRLTWVRSSSVVAGRRAGLTFSAISTHWTPVTVVARVRVNKVAVQAGGGLKVWAEQDEKQEGEDTATALPAEQVIASIRTAVAAKPGRVLKVEAESEDGKTLCEVEVLAENGKTYEVEVDVVTNKALAVELEDAPEDDDKD